MVKAKALLGRRGFLKAGGLAAAGFVAGGTGLLRLLDGSSGRRGHLKMGDLRKEHFEPHVGEEFSIEAEGVGRFEAKLVEAEGTTKGGVESFSLVFSAPADRLLPQGVRRVSHPTIGSHDIFLVPIGADESSVRYEAVFTRMA